MLNSSFSKCVLALRSHQTRENRFHLLFCLLLWVWSVCLRWSRCKTNKKLFPLGRTALALALALATILLSGGCIMLSIVEISEMKNVPPEGLDDHRSKQDEQSREDEGQQRHHLAPAGQTRSYSRMKNLVLCVLLDT